MRGARQLLTLRGPSEPRRGPALKELEIIRDGAVLIQDGRIAEVGLSRRVENLIQAHRAQEIDATGRVVMPGFVDCHARLWGPSFQDDDEAENAGATELLTAGSAMRNASARRLESRARQIVDGMIRNGTTTVEAKSGYGLDARGEMKALRVHARLDRAPLDFVSTFLAPRLDACEGIPWMCSELLPAIRRRTYARFAALRCGGAAFPIEPGRRYLQAARDLGFHLKVQLAPDAGADVVRLALEMEAASIDHLHEACPPDLESIARSNTMAVLLPEGATFLDSGRRLIDQGAAVALGTNFNPASNSTYSLPLLVAIAGAQLGMSPEEAICAVTHNAACAIGSAHMAGSLEVGRPADLLVLNARDYRDISRHFGVNLVNRTIKRGITIYQEGAVARRKLEA